MSEFVFFSRLSLYIFILFVAIFLCKPFFFVACTCLHVSLVERQSCLFAAFISSFAFLQSIICICAHFWLMMCGIWERACVCVSDTKQVCVFEGVLAEAWLFQDLFQTPDMWRSKYLSSGGKHTSVSHAADYIRRWKDFFIYFFVFRLHPISSSLHVFDCSQCKCCPRLVDRISNNAFPRTLMYIRFRLIVK